MQQSFVAWIFNLVIVGEKIVLAVGKKLGCVKTECGIVERYHHLKEKKNSKQEIKKNVYCY